MRESTISCGLWYWFIMRRERKIFYGGLFVATLGALIMYLSAAANGPDVETHFTREIHSESSPATLDKAVYAVVNWPKWHYMMADVKLTDLTGMEYSMRDQVLMKGSLVKYTVEPKQQKWKQFQLFATVTQYEPQKRVGFILTKDSTGRITKLFDHLEWHLEFIPEANGGTLIRGTAMGHTANWRARLFARIAEKILMNQVFYVDMEKLAHIDRPLNVNPLPVISQ